MEARLLPVALLFGLWVAFDFRLLFLGHTEVLLDSSRFFYPLWKWGADVWREGLIPLWNPDAAFGTPYLADPQMATWYPPLRFLYFLFPATTAFNLAILGHHLWALAGFFLFARNRGFSSWVALGGCFVFGFSFNMASLAWITSILLAVSWIPWVFLAADRLMEGRSGGFLQLLGALAMQMAAGYPLVAYLTLLTVGIDWLFLLGTNRHGERISAMALKMGWGFLALLGALFYNAAWLFPLAEMLPRSNLAERLTMSESLEWADLATWLNPFSHGHPLLSHPSTPFCYTVYFAGLPTVVFVFWGVFHKKAKKSSLFLLLATVLLSLGEKAGIGEWLKHFLPGYAFLARSGYWIPLVIFAATMVFMESLQAFLNHSVAPRKPSLDKLHWVVLAAVVYFAALLLGVPWELTSFWVSLLCLFTAGFVPGSSFSGYVRISLVLLSLFLSLGPVARGIHFTLPSSYYSPPETIGRFTLPGRIYQSPSFVDSLGTISRNSLGEVYEIQKQDLAPNLPLAYGKEEVCYGNPMFLDSFREWYLGWEGKAFPAKVLDYLNVRYQMDERSAHRMKDASGAQSRIGARENNGVFPKWFSVPSAKGWNMQCGLKDQFSGSFNFEKEAVSWEKGLAGSYSARKVQETFRDPNEVDLATQGSGRALLVSSETAYPGWVARVNGEWKPLEEVNGGFRALVLGNGEGDAKVVFRPNSFRLGFFLSFLSLGFGIGALTTLGRAPSHA